MNEITTRPEFLAHALAIEEEATERYAMFADQMETTNNPEVAALFRKMEGLEQKHADEIERMMEDADIPRLNPWEMNWGDSNESPEAVDFSDTHYLMTPYHALTLVLEAEQRAVAFFAGVADGNADDEVKRMAAEFAEEEREHVVLVEAWREKFPPPAGDWAEDMDPPNALE